jgi:transcription factor E
MATTGVMLKTALKTIFKRKTAPKGVKAKKKAKSKAKIHIKAKKAVLKRAKIRARTQKKARKKLRKARAKAKAVAKQPAIVIKKLTKAKALQLLKHSDATALILKEADQEGLKTFEFLTKIGKEIDEFTLADKVNLQINFVRSLLYKLYEKKLVSFSRERDKKKGWFIYSWQAHPDRLRYLLVHTKQEEVDRLEKRLAQSQDTFFCPTDSKTFDYVQAMETMFFCDVCGGKLEAVSSIEVRQKIERQIAELKNGIEELEKF